MILKSSNSFFEKMNQLFTSSEFWWTIAVVIVTLAIFIIIKEYSLKVIERKKQNADNMTKKRLTILNMFISLSKYAIFIFDILVILKIFGFHVTPILAGLGLFGAVIGLAFQDLFKDFIAGIFVILDNQYSVGDYISIDEFKGEVVSVGLKSTKIRDYAGDIRIFSNHLITDLVNHSQTNSKAVILFTFNSDINLLEVESAIHEIIKRCNHKKIPDLTRELKYKGVEKYDDSEITLKITADVKPLKQYKTENTIKREAKLIFDERGIKIK